MLVFCPRCGAEYPELTMGEYSRSNIACRDCGLAVAGEPAMLARSDDEVAFVLDEWPATHRGEAAALLVERDIPFRWEAGLALVVPAAEEDNVEALLDEAEAAADEAVADAEWDDDDPMADDEEDGSYEAGGPVAEDEEDGSYGAGRPAAGDEEDGSYGGGGPVAEDDEENEEGDEEGEGHEDDEGEDGGEEAHQAMSDLYLAADRFQHAPWDRTLGLEFCEAADRVADLLPPYGIGRSLWRQVQDLAATVVAHFEGEEPDDEIVSGDTRALRELLRSYV